MKKTKELLLFIALLIMPIILFFIVSGLKSDMLSNSLKFVGIANYIRMFFYDKIFIKALFNTVAMPILFGFLSVIIFAVIMLFVRKKIRTPRLTFYIGGVFIGWLISLICTVCMGISVSGAQNHIYATQTVTTHILDYSPSIFDLLSIQNVLLSLFVGIFTAFIFWILELIVDVVKKFQKRKGISNEQV